MNKRKKFNISDDITQGITDIIDAVDNETGKFRFRHEIIALSRIEIDPDNPRELVLNSSDILNGFNKTDSYYAKKKKEAEELETLAATIQDNGVINPIIVYKCNEKYRIVTGERRYLASLIAKKDNIHARIIDNKPNLLDIKILQWIENNEREDLSLHERISNIKSIIQAYIKTNAKEKITIALIQQLIGLSKTQAAFYLSIINAPSDLQEAIAKNEVNSLKKAVFIAGVNLASIREKLIDACRKGENLKFLKKITMDLMKAKRAGELSGKNAKNRRGRAATQVNLGKIKDIGVIKKLVEIVLSHPDYQQHKNLFDDINWERYDHASVTFHKLLGVLSGK